MCSISEEDANKDFTGTVTFYNPDKRNGFVSCHETEERYFIPPIAKIKVREGDIIRYKLQASPRGPYVFILEVIGHITDIHMSASDDQTVGSPDLSSNERMHEGETQATVY